MKLDLINSTAFRYVIIGGFSYLVEMTALWMLVSVIGLSSVAGVAISFWVGLVVAFLLQKFVAFQNHQKGGRVILRQASLYMVLVGVNYVITLLMVHALQASFSVYAIRTAAIILTTMWNYFAYKHLLFGATDSVK